MSGSARGGSRRASLTAEESTRTSRARSAALVKHSTSLAMLAEERSMAARVLVSEVSEDSVLSELLRVGGVVRSADVSSMASNMSR